MANGSEAGGENSEMGKRTASSKPSVMVVDDDMLVLKTTEQYLNESGYKVYVASSAKEALEAFENFAPEVIVTDLNMPQTGGLEMMEKIKEKAEGVEFIVISGYGKRDDAIKSLRMGSVDFLDKPVPMSELAEACTRAYERVLTRRASGGGAGRARSIIRELLKASADEREKLLETINIRLGKIVYPEIDHMIEEIESEDMRERLIFIKELLEGIFSVSNPLASHYSKLTPLEIKICNYLIQGKSSRNVAKALDRSLDTVYDHQKRIRSRLGLTNTRESLATFLRSENLTK